ncbi:MAG: hypothetical protein GF404_13685 [candidate division Zixibacteria bacterium]|nr:hypothetical protein [candidate division Zixibacteria bacterium]
MPAFLEKHYTLDLAKSAEFGPERRVYTLTCREISYGRQKSSKKLILTPRAGNEDKNYTQWNSLRELTEQENLLLFSFAQLRYYFPLEEYREYARAKMKSTIQIERLCDLFLPGAELDSPAGTTDFLQTILALEPDDQKIESECEHFLALLKRLAGRFDRSLLSKVSRIIAVSQPAVAEWLDSIKKATADPPRKLLASYPGHFIKFKANDHQADEDADGDPLRTVFSGENGLADVIPDYEHRPEQQSFASLFSRAIRNSEIFLAEAGTGTGKSLAYLVPLLMNISDERRAVVATYTRTLQSQLFFKDLKIAARAIKTGFRAAMLKGRSNYLCLLKKAMLSTRVARSLPSAELDELAKVEIWENLTTSGDLSEIKLSSNRLRAEVCADAGFCLRQNCQYYSRCYFYKARKQAHRAELVVANQALFFTDLLASGNILGTLKNVVFDEAHRIEKTATSHLSAELGRLHLLSLVSRLLPGRRQERSLLAEFLARLFKETSEHVQSEINQLRDDIQQNAEDFRRALIKLFEELAEFIRSHGYQADTFTLKLRYDRDKPLYSRIAGDLGQLCDFLEIVLERLGKLLRMVTDDDLEQPDRVLFEEMNQLFLELREVERVGHALMVADSERHVFWLEIPVRSEPFLCYAPLHVGPLLKDLIYDRYDCLLLTSASLSVEGYFDFYEKSMGLDLIEPERIIRKSFGSSFDFYRQVRFFCTAFLASPKSEYYSTSLGRLLNSLLPALRKKTLVLFTSYQLLYDIHNQISQGLRRHGFEVFAQGISGSPDRILKLYRESPLAVILGTDSFWEGVDLPGTQLEVLIITRLPFSSPSEPVDSARMETIEKAGESSFFTYSLPNAVLKFKQGFGRLIRQKSDTGMVFVTDNRLIKSNFGQIFLNSVPAELDIIFSPEELSGKLDIL